MKVSEEKLESIVMNLIDEKGLQGAKDFLATGNYDQELLDRAMKIISKEENRDPVLVEHGDISDFG